MNNRRTLLAAAVAFPFVAGSDLAVAAAGLLTLEYDRGTDYSTLTVTCPAAKKVTSHLLRGKEPHRFLIDIEGVRLTAAIQKSTQALKLDKFVSRVRVGQFQANTLRVVVELKHDISAAPLMGSSTENFGVRFAHSADIIAVIAEQAERTSRKNTAPAARNKTIGAETIRVIIDPGHGGMDVGTVAADGTAEKEINLAIARDLYAFAVISGIPASMTRTGDYLVYKAGDDKKRSDLYNRFDYINSVDNAVLVSIHQNHFADTSQWGMQIWYTVNDPLSKALAANILAYDKQHLQPGNRRENKPSDDSYYLLYQAKVPSVMVECGFMSNVKENNQLKQDVYRRRVAFCILAGLSDTMKTGELP